MTGEVIFVHVSDTPKPAPDPWREEFEKVADVDGQTALYFADSLRDDRATLEDIERQVHAAANERGI